MKRFGAAALAVALGWTAAARAEAPFDPGLNRLSEVLGSLEFLSALCGKPGGWRERMQSLADAEAPSGARREAFAASFERGYTAFSATYTRCTPSALAAIKLYVSEGEALSRRLADRYGN